MYQIKNRNVHEHELYSFSIQRDNLKVLARANNAYIAELNRQDAITQLGDYSVLQGAVYKRRILSPRRFKGLGAFAASMGIYNQLPYLAVYFGSTIPVVTAAMAALYGIISFSDANLVNSITVNKDGPFKGKLTVNMAESPLFSKDLIVDVRDLKSVVALGDEELGEDAQDGNIILISKYINEEGQTVEEDVTLTLPGDAFRDKVYMDWLLSDKSGETDLTDDYTSLLQQRYDKLSLNGTLDPFNVLFAKADLQLVDSQKVIVDQQLATNDSSVDENLRKLLNLYGKEHVNALSDKELYDLFKKHAA